MHIDMVYLRILFFFTHFTSPQVFVMMNNQTERDFRASRYKLKGNFVYYFAIKFV